MIIIPPPPRVVANLFRSSYTHHIHEHEIDTQTILYIHVLTIFLYSTCCLISLSSLSEYRASLVMASTGPLSTCCFMARNNTYSGSPTHSCQNISVNHKGQGKVYKHIFSSKCVACNPHWNLYYYTQYGQTIYLNKYITFVCIKFLKST